MAIGKQGAYATVEGGVVDFGKMTSEAIDKYQTQQALQEKLKQEKAAAKAKAISDEVKNLKVMGKYTSSGMKEIDDPALLLTHQYANALGEIGAKVQTGELNSFDYNQMVSKADQALEVMNQSAKYARERASAYTKLSDENKLNPDFIKPDAIKNVMKDTVPVLNENGSTTYNYKDADGNIFKTENPNEIIDKVFGNPVLKVELNTEMKKIKDVLDQDKIAKAGANFVVTQTEQSKRFLGGVSTSAANLLGDRNIKAELWSDYQRSLPAEKRVGPKADGFSEKENQDLYEYTNNKIIQMYPEEKSLANIPKSGGGGGGSNKDNKNLPMTPSSLYVMKPQEIELTNGGKVKVKANELIGYPASNTIYGKDETGTKQAVTLLKNKRTKELFIRTASAKTTSEGTGIKTGQVSETTSETSKKENYIYAGSHTASDDFLRLAEGYIGVTYTGKDGQKHTVESSSIQELNKYIEARDSQVGIKNKPTVPSKTTTKTATKKEIKGF